MIVSFREMTRIDLVKEVNSRFDKDILDKNFPDGLY